MRDDRRLGGAPLIDIQNVGKSFAPRNSAPVFVSFSCMIESGSFVSIIGPSGCGKSTLLKLIAGLEEPTEGQIVFEGKEVCGPPKGMIYVFQQYSKSIFPWRTVIQNIEFGVSIQKKFGRAELRERCQEYVSLVGLSGYEDYYPAQLSGGMQQRVVIARALICEPKVLLMDEPFSAVDAMTRALLQELTLKIWESIPITIIFVTHDVDEAVFLSTRIISLGRRPALVREDVAVDLAHPREQIVTRSDPKFNAVRQKLFASIFLQEKQMIADQPESLKLTANTYGYKA